MEEKVKLEGFNNISKSIFISFYRFCYASGGGAQIEKCLNWLNDSYLAMDLSQMISLVAKEVGAQILSSSRQDYDPIGASAVALLAEPSEGFPPIKGTAKGTAEDIAKNTAKNGKNTANSAKDAVKSGKNAAKSSVKPIQNYSEICHLDKSHIAVHTYPEANRQTGVCTFRIDFDLSTCGVVSPLSSLTHCIRFFNADLITVDYRQRGFTRELTGARRYRDGHPETMMDILDKKLLSEFTLKETQLTSHRMHLASLKRKDLESVSFSAGSGGGSGRGSAGNSGRGSGVDNQHLSRYFYAENLDALDEEELRKGLALIKHEIDSIEQEI